jgi:hypothetical protein
MQEPIEFNRRHHANLVNKYIGQVQCFISILMNRMVRYIRHLGTHSVDYSICLLLAEWRVSTHYVFESLRVRAIDY